MLIYSFTLKSKDRKEFIITFVIPLNKLLIIEHTKDSAHKNKNFPNFTFAQSENGLMRFVQEKHLVRAYIIQAFAKLSRLHAFIKYKQTCHSRKPSGPDTSTYHLKLFSSVRRL